MVSRVNDKLKWKRLKPKKEEKKNQKRSEPNSEYTSNALRVKSVIGKKAETLKFEQPILYIFEELRANGKHLEHCTKPNLSTSLLVMFFFCFHLFIDCYSMWFLDVVCVAN